MRQIPAVLALLLALASAAAAQDGGKLDWKGKSNPQQAILDAKALGKPMMLFFTSDG